MRTLSALYPIWIGIVFNLLLAGGNLYSAAHQGLNFVQQYVQAEPYAFVVAWLGLVCWSLYNWVSYKD